MSRTAAIVLYDAECRFCRWSLAWLLRCDHARRLEPVALQETDRARALLDGMGESERMASWHLVCDGSVASAGAAAPGLLRLLPGGRPFAALAARFPAGVERAYSWVARNRSLLGRRLSDGAIARADARIAERRG